ncbi:hypothetical protein [Amycolatopsis sp. FDAARGOS 1241]|uniref:hypothetical protein n=1 Tax=Amycolatopsis sp. FDAARGOS 1241 TaxID=2778070 RepID=UPI001EF1F21F|nr:hypothetical protein [Amycolatopsis sp. FDAARGOS 1241]
MAEGEEIFPGVTVMLSPGHSVGHSAYAINAGGKRVISFGDAFSIHFADVPFGHVRIQDGRAAWDPVDA